MNADNRLRKSEPNRVSRAAEDNHRKADGLVSTDIKTRLELIEKFQQEALPKAPEIPGFHTCWLSTTNQYDPIHRRMQLGYTAVLADEVPGFDHLKVKSGEQNGHIAVNEMVLYKIPEDIYQAIMQQLHHYQPMEEHEKLAIQEEQLMGTLRDSKGRPLVQREGENPFTAPRDVPVFS